ncbi:hypothetical protein LPJ70_001373 [Coemansia sp. RSA 2708]|nr:hypothetical protein LPJ70_001373 [Coemansia sp. RSA 2708]
MVPYKNSKWVRHINNALFAYNAYGFAKDNGIIRHRDMDTREIAPTRDLMSPDVSNPLQDIASSLIRPGNGNVVEQFDDRWAVPRKAAEHYYNLIYHTKTGLYSASAQMLGAAAAIQALRTHYSNYGNGYQHEHSEMGLVLSEVNYLVSHKAETGYANANDTLEMVGKIALATLIKIKLDEERTYRPW